MVSLNPSNLSGPSLPDLPSPPSAGEVGESVGGKVGKEVAEAPATAAGGGKNIYSKWQEKVQAATDFAIMWGPISFFLATSLVSGGTTLLLIFVWLWFLGKTGYRS